VRVTFTLVVGLVVLALLAACAGGEGVRRDGPTPASGSREPPHSPAEDVAVDAIGVPLRAPGFDAARTMTVHLLDVGQGAATLLEFPCGAVLIDTGGESNESFNVEAELRRQIDAFFARRSDLNRTLDLLIITHPHIDHLRGLPTLLESVTVQNIVDNGDRGDELVAREMKVLARYLEEKKPGHRSVRLDDIVKRNGLTDDVIDPVACDSVDPKLRVLWGGLDSDPGWGTDNYGKPRFANQNNHSVVTRVDFGATSLLVTGDLEDIAIHALLEKYDGTRWLDVDIYQAGHHGSANGTTRPLVEALTPSLALIAMGDPDRQHQWTAWAYGHPRAGIVDVLHDGVGLERPPVEVLVGKGTKRFTSRTIHRAIFGTGWDGAVAVDVGLDGEIAVRRRLKRR
jgi:competence protein ComEC